MRGAAQGACAACPSGLLAELVLPQPQLSAPTLIPADEGLGARGPQPAPGPEPGRAASPPGPSNTRTSCQGAAALGDGEHSGLLSCGPQFEHHHCDGHWYPQCCHPLGSLGGRGRERPGLESEEGPVNWPPQLGRVGEHFDSSLNSQKETGLRWDQALCGGSGQVAFCWGCQH